MRLVPKAFSLVEVMLAGVIFTIAVAGVFASIASVKSPVNVSNGAVKAANCGQIILEWMRAKVDARDWDSGALQIANNVMPGVSPSDCPGYSYRYDVSDVGNGARRVDLRVTWTP